MHGIFFGSNDEIEFAHKEGFLFELFRDTGFFNISIDYKKTKISENPNKANKSDLKTDDEIEDFEDLIKSIENTYYNFSINEDEFGHAIDKVINTNIKKDNTFKSISNIENTKKAKIFRNLSSESFNENISESSSIMSLNKESYCRNYVDKNVISFETNNKMKNYDVDLKKFISNINKTDVIDHNKDLNEISTDSMKKFTPPGDVLATINCWLKKTKDAINARNAQMSKKNLF